MIFGPTLEAICLNLSPEDADDLRQERAGILEFEGGLTRAEAGRRARIDAPAALARPLQELNAPSVNCHED